MTQAKASSECYQVVGKNGYLQNTTLHFLPIKSEIYILDGRAFGIVTCGLSLKRRKDLSRWIGIA